MRIAVVLSLAVAAVVTLAACGASRPARYVGHSRAATLELVGPRRKADAQVWDLSLRFTRVGTPARKAVEQLRNPAAPTADLMVFCLSDRGLDGLSEAGVGASQLRGETLTVHFVNLHKASRWTCGLRDGRNPKDRVGESRATYIANSIVAATLTRR